jgi:hypothetical protein
MSVNKKYLWYTTDMLDGHLFEHEFPNTNSDSVINRIWKVLSENNLKFSWEFRNDENKLMLYTERSKYKLVAILLDTYAN